MVGSMFAAIAGLKAHQTRMDVIGNNIANVNTWGYKSQSVNFMDATYRNKINGAGGGLGTGGGVNPSQIGYGSNIGSITTNFTTGNWNPTGWGSDCMVNGPGYFAVVQNAASAKGTATNPSKSGDNATVDLTGNGSVLLSRVGILGIDNKGYLVDAQGNYVLDRDGFVVQTAGKDGSITYSSLTVLADGTVTGIVATGKGFDEAGDQNVEKGGVAIVAKLGVAIVGNPNGMEKTEGYYYRLGENSGTTTLMKPDKATTGEVLGGYLEMSNTNLSDEMANMITTQRGFQANTKIITVTDQMLEELVNMKR